MLRAVYKLDPMIFAGLLLVCSVIASVMVDVSVTTQPTTQDTAQLLFSAGEFVDSREVILKTEQPEIASTPLIY